MTGTLLRPPPYIFWILGVISILAAVIFTCTAKRGYVLTAGSTALRNQGGFGGKSHSIISLVFGSSDTSCIRSKYSNCNSTHEQLDLTLLAAVG